MDEYFMSVHHTHHRAKQRTPQTRWLKSVGRELYSSRKNIAVPAPSLTSNSVTPTSDVKFEKGSNRSRIIKRKPQCGKEITWSNPKGD
jgi:hypothetical protein